MFLKHTDDLLFQTATGCDTSEPSPITKNAAVKDCLEFSSYL